VNVHRLTLLPGEFPLELIDECRGSPTPPRICVVASEDIVPITLNTH
jgi:hypothetical protein